MDTNQMKNDPYKIEEDELVVIATETDSSISAEAYRLAQKVTELNLSTPFKNIFPDHSYGFVIKKSDRGKVEKELAERRRFLFISDVHDALHNPYLEF